MNWIINSFVAQIMISAILLYKAMYKELENVVARSLQGEVAIQPFLFL